MTERSYDATALQALLPHRPPFLLVDRVDVIEPGRQVVGFKRLTVNEWWAVSTPRGSKPSIPFGLVLEALAQASGALIPDLADDALNVVPYFMAADHVRLRRHASPGEELRLDISLIRWRRGVCRTHGIATVEGVVVLSADLTAVVRGVA
jgi:3-hydroxyacyl-[acyl-carrier-protein] dehydratase